MRESGTKRVCERVSEREEKGVGSRETACNLCGCGSDCGCGCGCAVARLSVCLSLCLSDDDTLSYTGTHTHTHSRRADPAAALGAIIKVSPRTQPPFLHSSPCPCGAAMASLLCSGPYARLAPEASSIASCKSVAWVAQRGG